MEMIAKDLAGGLSRYTDYYGPSGIFYYLITIAAEKMYRAIRLLIIA
jgi:hypothetical protein